MEVKENIKYWKVLTVELRVSESAGFADFQWRDEGAAMPEHYTLPGMGTRARQNAVGSRRARARPSVQNEWACMHALEHVACS